MRTFRIFVILFCDFLCKTKPPAIKASFALILGHAILAAIALITSGSLCFCLTSSSLLQFLYLYQFLEYHVPLEHEGGLFNIF